MHALVLNGSSDGDTFANQVATRAISQLREAGWEADEVILRTCEIVPCIGCFSCWVRSPGECMQDDDAPDITRRVTESDLLVLVTPVTFGGYSFQMKKYLDRAISLILPFFARLQGEVHHEPRYEQLPNLLALGTLGEPDPEGEKIFKWLVSRNALNLHVPAHLAEVIVEDRDHVDERVASVIAVLLEGNSS